MNIDLILKDIQDVYTRENFTRLLKFFNLTDLLNGEFKFFEVEILKTNTVFAVPHGLNFIPQDVIFVSVEGDHNFYFRYQEFTRTNMYIFVQGPCKLRFFAGAYKDQNYGRKVSDLTLVPPASASGSGTTWFTGTGAPLSTVGSTGDFYLDTSTYDVYLKISPTVWVLSGNMSPDGGSGYSLKVVEAGESKTIPVNQQMLVDGHVTVLGSLSVLGEVVDISNRKKEQFFYDTINTNECVEVEPDRLLLYKDHLQVNGHIRVNGRLQGV